MLHMQAAAAPVDAAAAASHGWEVRPVAEAAAEAGPSSGVPQAAPVVPRGTALVWLRRDLRLDDNPALTAALKTGGTVVRPHTASRRVWEEVCVPAVTGAPLDFICCTLP